MLRLGGKPFLALRDVEEKEKGLSPLLAFHSLQHPEGQLTLLSVAMEHGTRWRNSSLLRAARRPPRAEGSPQPPVPTDHSQSK